LGATRRVVAFFAVGVFRTSGFDAAGFAAAATATFWGASRFGTGAAFGGAAFGLCLGATSGLRLNALALLTGFARACVRIPPFFAAPRVLDAAPFVFPFAAIVGRV
jgi:hypothetical protein